LEEIGEVHSTSITYVVVYEDVGFEDLDLGHFPLITSVPPLAYRNYPSIANIYFNVAHFWNQHLSCYLKGTQSAFLDAVAANLNTQIASGYWDSPFAVYSQNTMTYEGNVIQYNVWHFPGSDFLVGTAYIPGKPNC